jgi:hypothetical protein
MRYMWIVSKKNWEKLTLSEERDVGGDDSLSDISWTDNDSLRGAT